MSNASHSVSRVMNANANRRWSVAQVSDGWMVQVEESWKGEWSPVSVAGAMVRASEAAAADDMHAAVAEWDARFS